jgi:hypothetical protein
MSPARAALALASGLVALAASAAPAMPCGSSGGGSDSGGSSSGGSSSDSGSSSSSSSEPACVETSAVVGRSTCPENRYGTWRVPSLLPRFRVAFGASVHRFSLSGMSFSGTAAHETGIAYRMVGDEISSSAASAMTMDLAITGRIGRYAYVGLGSSVGHAMVDSERIEREGSLSMSASGNLYVEAGVVSGISVPMGSFAIGAEAFAGPRIVGMSIDSQHLDCESSSFAFDSEWLIETRVTAQTWLTPWLTVGGRVGSNVLQRGDMSVGVFLQGHTRAFDATRSR